MRKSQTIGKVQGRISHAHREELIERVEAAIEESNLFDGDYKWGWRGGALMANVRYLRCEKCGCDAMPRPFNKVTGRLAECGTPTLTRCRDCAGKDGYATLCRDCCPTGARNSMELDGVNAEDEPVRIFFYRP